MQFLRPVLRAFTLSARTSWQSRTVTNLQRSSAVAQACRGSSASRRPYSIQQQFSAESGNKDALFSSASKSQELEEHIQAEDSSSAFATSNEAQTDSGQQIPTSSKVLYVGNLYFEATPEAVKERFEQFGEIDTVRIVYDNRGMSRGFAHVTYSNLDSAARAIEGMHEQIFMGRRIRVQYHIPREPKPSITPRTSNEPCSTLFIGNMSFDMTDQELTALFRELKDVTNVRVAIDRQTGRPRGFAHADFLTVESAKNALEILKEKEFYGRRLRVDYGRAAGSGRSDST